MRQQKLSISSFPITGRPRYSTRRYYTNLDITRFCFGPHFFPRASVFFLFYNMKSSYIEKNLSYRLVNTVEISVNTVVVIIKMGLSSRHEVYMSKRIKYASPLIKTIDVLIPIKFLSKHRHTFVDYKYPTVNKQILIDPRRLTLLISHIPCHA